MLACDVPTGPVRLGCLKLDASYSADLLYARFRAGCSRSTHQLAYPSTYWLTTCNHLTGCPRTLQSKALGYWDPDATCLALKEIMAASIYHRLEHRHSQEKEPLHSFTLEDSKHARDSQSYNELSEEEERPTSARRNHVPSSRRTYTIRAAFLLAIVLALSAALGYQSMDRKRELAARPMLGWSSWNR